MHSKINKLMKLKVSRMVSIRLNNKSRTWMLQALSRLRSARRCSMSVMLLKLNLLLHQQNSKPRWTLSRKQPQRQLPKLIRSLMIRPKTSNQRSVPMT